MLKAQFIPETDRCGIYQQSATWRLAHYKKKQAVNSPKSKTYLLSIGSQIKRQHFDSYSSTKFLK
jgi:hypothetical protein